MYDTFQYRYLHAGMGLAADLRADAYETDDAPPPTGRLINAPCTCGFLRTGPRTGWTRRGLLSVLPSTPSS
ncbi:hypothetical protein OHT57_01355 [Streptomyces sp. NBC_00285]|uniref:hypothetical protein n=1 Tax=Streptomyces sp. NBC_00285 TaxID=2975700 RepID=UPI002E298EC2|nr:hypothetical protein [Streptomyces sp. NBC_00285]